MPSKQNQTKSRRNKLILQRSLLELLTFSPMFVGITLLFFPTALRSPWIISQVFFIFGFTGVITMVRREIPTPLSSTRGTGAVVRGALFTIFH